MLLDKAFRVNENGASFYEKLILFDVGTIALSLTLLGQIVAHTSGGHVPKHPFIWFLCPAWPCYFSPFNAAHSGSSRFITPTSYSSNNSLPRSRIFICRS